MMSIGYRGAGLGLWVSGSRVFLRPKVLFQTQHRAVGVRCSTFKSIGNRKQAAPRCPEWTQPPYVDRCGQARQKGRLVLCLA